MAEPELIVHQRERRRSKWWITFWVASIGLHLGAAVALAVSPELRAWLFKTQPAEFELSESEAARLARELKASYARRLADAVAELDRIDREMRVAGDKKRAGYVDLRGAIRPAAATRLDWGPHNPTPVPDAKADAAVRLTYAGANDAFAEAGRVYEKVRALDLAERQNVPIGEALDASLMQLPEQPTLDPAVLEKPITALGDDFEALKYELARAEAAAEKMVAGDGRADVNEILGALQESARRLIHFGAAEGGQVNAVMLGAIIGSGVLPLGAAECRAAIEGKGIAVAGNLAAFEQGLALAGGNSGATAAATADEPDELNFIAKHVRAYRAQHDCDLETAALRVFSNADGAYGSNINQLVEEGCWNDEDELADAFSRRKSFAYGLNGTPTAQAGLMQDLLGQVDLAYQNLESVEVGLTTIDHYFDTLGGIGRAAAKAQGAEPSVYIGDHTRGEGAVRSLADQVALETRTRTLNPKWYEGMLRHGYEGVRQIEAQITNTMGWSATTKQVAPWVYQRMTETFVLDEALRERLATLNPKACAKVANRLIEASERNYWQPDPETLAALMKAGEDLEDRIEGVTAPAGAAA